MSNTRRGAGEGALARRPDGLWEARLDLGWQDGKRVRRSYYGKTKREAQDKRDAAKVKVALGTLAPRRSLKLKAFLSSWLEDVARPRLKVSTAIRYAELLNRHIIPGLGHIPVDKLTIMQVQTFLNERQKAGSSPRTAHHMRAVLRTALNYAIRARLVTINVAALADSPHIPPREKTFLKSPAEVRAFMAAAAEDRMAALFTLALGLGLRQGELLGLRWSDINFDRRTLEVVHSARRVRVVKGEPTELLLSDVKTKASRRTLPMPEMIVEALQRHREQQARELQALPGPSAFVFTNPDGSAFEAKQVMPIFRDLLIRAGLSPMRFHDLRHSCATWLMVNRVPPRVVMMVMGHSDLKTTMEIYSHVSSEMLAEATDAMQRILVGGNFGG